MTAAQPAGRDYWRDPDHECLRVSFVSADGAEITEMGEALFTPPLNKNTAAPVKMKLEIMHADGCRRVIDVQAIRCW